MKAMILSAGLGERMRPLTNKTPKPLLKVKGIPLIVYHLKALEKAGIKDIVINVHYHADQIKDTLKNGHQYGVNIQYSDEPELLDTGGGVRKALPLLGDEPFILLSADIWTDYSFENLATHSLKGLTHLVLVKNPDFHPEGDFYWENGKLSSTGSTKLTYANIGVFHPNFFKDKPSGSTYSLAESIFKAIENNQATGEFYQGMWANIGTPEQLQAIES